MEKDEWNRFILSHEDSCFFHRYEWKLVIEKVFGFKPHYIINKQNNLINSVLPLFEAHNRLISVPFSTQGGVISSTPQLLIDKAIQLAKDKNLDYLELRQQKKLDTNMQLKDYYYHMQLKLGKDPKIVWEKADKKMRNAVRKARKLGLTTDRGVKYFEDFYRLFARNIRDLGTPVDKKEFFIEIINQFRDDVDIVVTKLNSKVIGAIFLLKHKNIIKSEWAVSDRKYFGYNAAQLMYWRAIEDACKEFQVFDFGRSIKDEGTYNFKKKFGALPVQLHYLYYINKGSMPDIRKTSKKRKLFAWCWSKTPLFITNKLGPIIRERFP